MVNASNHRRPADLEIVVRQLTEVATRYAIALRRLDVDGRGVKALQAGRRSSLEAVFTSVNQADYRDIAALSDLLDRIAKAPLSEIDRLEAQYR